MKTCKTEIKICGLSDGPTVGAAIDAGADLIGLIFFDKSPRNVSFEKAAELSALASGRAGIVCVSVNADDALLGEMVRMVKPDYLQLHGDETTQRVSEIRHKFSLPVIKAFSIRNADDLSACGPYAGIADRFLFDAKAPAGSQLPGGNGVSFDWTLLSDTDFALPWMLSGGLDADNILQALEVSRATRIDVSSGVESSPGVKDIEKIATFIKTVRDRDNRAALLASRQVGASA